MQTIAPSPSLNEKMEIQIEERNEEIKQLAKENLSCKSENDCVALATGIKACGGPREYIVTSAHNDIALLKDLIEDVTALEREYAIATDQISTCDFVMPPQLKCKVDICEMISPYTEVIQ